MQTRFPALIAILPLALTPFISGCTDGTIQAENLSQETVVDSADFETERRRKRKIVRPAENGPQDMVLMGTPTYENVTGRPTDPVQLSMLAAMLPHVQVGLVVNDLSEAENYSARLAAEFDVSAQALANLVPLEIEHTDIWFRDMGGVFVHVKRGSKKKLAVIDFEFDGWGYGAFSEPDQVELYEIDNQVAHKLGELLDMPVIRSPLIAEGGAFQSNGEGVIAYSLLALTQRNPGWTQKEIEAELKRVTGAKKLLALPTFHPFDGHAVLDAPLELDGTFFHLPVTVRHADEFMQFVDANTILVAQLDDEDVTNALEQEVKDRLDEIWDFLAASTDANGEPFELIPFPDPGMITETVSAGDVVWDYLGTLRGIKNYDPAGGQLILPAAYMNFVLTNNVVIVPRFFQPGRSERLIESDAEAVRILSEVFAPREVVQVDAENITVGGGGMHCITQEIRSL